MNTNKNPELRESTGTAHQNARRPEPLEKIWDPCAEDDASTWLVCELNLAEHLVTPLVRVVSYDPQGAVETARMAGFLTAAAAWEIR